MYNLKDIKDVHFEITSKCQAKCPMCPRRIAGGPLNPFIKFDLPYRDSHLDVLLHLF